MTSPIVKRYSIAFDKYKWVGLASLVLVVAGSTVVAIQPDPPPTYVANGALTHTRPPVTFSLTGTEIQQAGQSLTQEVLLQDQILETVATKVNLKPKQLIENIILKVPAEAPAKADGASTPQIIEIRFKDSDSKRALRTVEELMVAMIKLSGEINTGRLKSIIKKVNERIPQAKSELVAVEKKLEQFDRVERPAILAAENGSLLTAITATQAQQRQLQLALSGIDAQIVSLQQRLGLSADQAYFSSALSADPIIANLRAQIYQTESQIEVFKRDLRPEHPTMIQLQRQREANLTLLQQRAAEVISGGGSAARLRGQLSNIRSQSNLDPARQQWANQLVTLETQRETLRKQLVDEGQSEAKLRREYSLIPNKQLERSRLEQEVALKKAVYDKMQTKLTDSEVAESETVSSLAVARPPVVIADKRTPKNVPMTLGFGGILGLVVGGGVIFLLGSLEGTFKTKEDIRENLKQREVANLGELPLMPTYDLAKHELPVLFSNDSVYLEFYEKFRSNLRRIGGKDLKVLLITSTTPDEGKTVSAYNLGVACARAGKRTLIVEMDLRSPSHAASLRVTPDADAVVEPLRYYSNLSECVRLVPDIENLYIVPSPGPVRQSAAIIESSELRRLLEDARQRFDFVILDTCTLSLSNDPLLIQPYSDGILLVTRPNYTQENMLGEAIDQLTEAELGLVGVIINGAEDVIISTTKSTTKLPVDSIEESSETAAAMRN
jgi:capsular exopolysaccharide synthesis family protein